MKRALLLVFAFCIGVSMAACGGGQSSPAAPAAESPPAVSVSENTSASTKMDLSTSTSPPISTQTLPEVTDEEIIDTIQTLHTFIDVNSSEVGVDSSQVTFMENLAASLANYEADENIQRVIWFFTVDHLAGSLGTEDARPVDREEAHRYAENLFGVDISIAPPSDPAYSQGILASESEYHTILGTIISCKISNVQISTDESGLVTATYDATSTAEPYSMDLQDHPLGNYTTTLQIMQDENGTPYLRFVDCVKNS
ncbi:hypothetical protein LJC49_09110 [Ruminococcaceae bacterium OttesenSCG-928-I18]|nr:hypothetical protein [Ruminococcaceae bacterium OttesenSCG-928-I18]